MGLPISKATWRKLVKANEAAEWARKGVFATAEGKRYKRGGQGSILYIGQSAGVRGSDVSSASKQHQIGADSRHWMEDWQTNNPRSGFWQLIESIVDTEELAWTNLCKMDSLNGKTPKPREFASVSEICTKALSEEFSILKPKLCLFVNYKFGERETANFLAEHRFQSARKTVVNGTHRGAEFSGYLHVYECPSSGQLAIHTVHPQGKSPSILRKIQAEVARVLR